ncbi:MAG: transposase, partial [Candidatus Competibacteraceae bacterium]|nr:transposase [Candidatus Competibacteraceae bacterium]
LRRPTSIAVSTASGAGSHPSRRPQADADHQEGPPPPVRVRAERELSATNNGSERALRPCAVYRKITNGFRSEWGAALYANIRSVVETARRRAVRALDAIRLTLKGEHIPVPA